MYRRHIPLQQVTTPKTREIRIPFAEPHELGSHASYGGELITLKG